MTSSTIDNASHQICPLCESTVLTMIHNDKDRAYFRCKTCELIFVPPAQFLSAEEEKTRYDLHQNNPDDKEYRRFLSRLFVPMQKRLAPESRGLDFGSGPGPTLSLMFEEAGHSMVTYDQFYGGTLSALEDEYDFITATEVAEHLRDPKKEMDKLWACLKPGGSLGLMTKLALDTDKFKDWHYIKDLTHICFFSRSTFEWLADRWQAELTFIDNDVILFKKTDCCLSP
ncbi:class I SAM-dependent methyltransferase [Verrucomicrobiota bacterium]